MLATFVDTSATSCRRPIASAEACSVCAIWRCASSWAYFCSAIGSGLRVGLVDMRMLTIEFSGQASGRQR